MTTLPDDWRGMWVQREGGAIVGAYANPQPGFAEEPLAEDDAELVAFLTPPERPVIIPYGVFRARWEPGELEALFEARKTHWQVDDFVSLAAAQNAVNLSRSTAAEARSLFVSLGVLSAERAEEIFSSEEE